jgi:hypothetical protein
MPDEEPKDDVIEAEESEGGITQGKPIDLTKFYNEVDLRKARMVERGRVDIDKTYVGFADALRSGSEEAISAALRAEADRRETEWGEKKGPYHRGRLAVKVNAGEYDA